MKVDETVLGYLDLALFCVGFAACVTFLIWKWTGAISRDRKRQALMCPVMIAGLVFCALRIGQISCQLNLFYVQENMIASFVLETCGNIAFLLTFTLIAMVWIDLLIQVCFYFLFRFQKKNNFQNLKSHVWQGSLRRLRVVLWAGMLLVSALLIGFMIWECIDLGVNFGAQPHDG